MKRFEVSDEAENIQRHKATTTKRIVSDDEEDDEYIPCKMEM